MSRPTREDLIQAIASIDTIPTAYAHLAPQDIIVQVLAITRAVLEREERATGAFVCSCGTSCGRGERRWFSPRMERPFCSPPCRAAFERRYRRGKALQAGGAR